MKRVHLTILFTLLVAVPGGCESPVPTDPDQRADLLLAQMTQDEKIQLVTGSGVPSFGVDVNLGGKINLIGREPRDGRTFETKGEDPFLAGEIAAAHIRGIQDHHILGCIKHFAFNDQETGRALANAWRFLAKPELGNASATFFFCVASCTVNSCSINWERRSVEHKRGLSD